MREEWQKRKVILTWEAIYDIADIVGYIEVNFGKERADRFQFDIHNKINALSYTGEAFGKTRLFYRKYGIYKRPFPPSVIFYVIKIPENEVHVLRVLRQECDWEKILYQEQSYTY